MCVHPEVFNEWRRSKRRHEVWYHTTTRKPHNLPSKAQWMIRNTHYPSNDKEKFALDETVQTI